MDLPKGRLLWTPDWISRSTRTQTSTLSASGGMMAKSLSSSCEGRPLVLATRQSSRTNKRAGSLRLVLPLDSEVRFISFGWLAGLQLAASKDCALVQLCSCSSISIMYLTLQPFPPPQPNKKKKKNTNNIPPKLKTQTHIRQDSRRWQSFEVVNFVAVSFLASGFWLLVSGSGSGLARFAPAWFWGLF